ncbi:bis-aminopropyl spermidine synthase family protein [Natronosporangium hydrolyticum]|uniref:Bis-aminopropyl spermidine synthase family protein n=1 Tax=Natronosporangium hydrolyticum TaxID=2811111 RepID=A0A895YEA2_9ACTN|nr:bis-aminopropyl spermidine synthase family protein [Natronosporangium hydrolyticum]QSB13729.1 bis-aminopropyl spermidine synthase family protein [Natronosporangium hydrolyticum]
MTVTSRYQPPSTTDPLDQLAGLVAAATQLAEGPTGVVELLATIRRREPVAIRDLSRLVEIPVPVVAAVCNELRRRGLVAPARPVRLTELGRSCLAPAAGPGSWPAPDRCDRCDGHGTRAPARAADALPELAALGASAPPAAVTLDQAHCTAETALRRVLFLAEHGLLHQRLLFLGDDDLTSLAVALLAHRTGAASRRLSVVDVDPRVLDYLGRHAPIGGPTLELIHHDLVDPLPAGLTGAFDVVVTDPPYTTPGAELFLSRAVAALAPGGGRHVLLAFGARPPDETVRLQRLFAELGLALRSMAPNFNEYHGAGSLAGTSHLYHLRTTAGSRPSIVGRHQGPLYTAQTGSRRPRWYRCLGCRARLTVGPDQTWPVVADLRQAGCPHCGAHRFRPLPRQQEVVGDGAAGQ